jgi:hypothetical protein
MRGRRLAIALATAAACIGAIAEYYPYGPLGVLRPFFVLHWLLNYDGGFIRRGLLGALLPDALTHDVAWMHVAGVVLVGLLAWQMQRALGVLLPDTRSAVVVRVVIALSPMTGVLMQTVSDPLHVVLVIWLTCSPAIRRWPDRWAGMALGAMIGVLVFVHEATAFVVGPASVLLLRSTHARIGLGLWIAAVGAIVGVFGQVTPGRQDALIAAVTQDWPGWSTTVLQPREMAMFWTPRQLAEVELAYFSPGNLPTRAVHFVAGAVAPIIGGFLCRVAGARPFLSLWWRLLLVALPLFMVGHDWARFLVYFWIVSVAVAAARREAGSPDPALVPHTGAIAGLSAALLLTSPLPPLYFIFGTHPVVAGIATMIAVIVWDRWGRRRS